MADLAFYFDVVCPYAYIASSRVEVLCLRCGATLEWKPCLLGGLYHATKAPQGKAGSATAAMSAQRVAIATQDLRREVRRAGLPPLNPPASHPVRTLQAQRWLCATEPPSARVALAKALYAAYWVDALDLANLDNDGVTERVLRKLAPEAVASARDGLARMLQAPSAALSGTAALEAADALRANTAAAVEAGAFGVPAFVVRRSGRLFWGQDRMLFVEAALRKIVSSAVPRPVPRVAARSASLQLRFFFDFGSPWAFLGSTQAQRVAAEHGAELVYVPILLGAVFKAIGTANLPMLEMSSVKRAYGSLDVQDWQKHWRLGTTMGFPSSLPAEFPVRTVLPLRAAIASECNRAVVDALFRAVWVDDMPIGTAAATEAVLAPVVGEREAARLVALAAQPAAKGELKANTARALESGVCGVPSFQISVRGRLYGEVFFGQDRLEGAVSDALQAAGQDGARL